jgi:large subunit ribosomal protein L5
MKTTLKETFEKVTVPELKKELGILNSNAVPRVEKVVINIGLGRANQQPSFKDKLLPEIEKELAALCGQKPAPRGAKKSIAGFKLREGQVIGLSATLRGARMYDFIYKLTMAVYPRVRDFRGVDLKNIDKQGNLNLGFKEHVIFPEIIPEVSMAQFGLQITVVVRNIKKTTDAIALYSKLGFRFKEPAKTAKRKK